METAQELEQRLRRVAGLPPENPMLDNGPWDFLLREPAEWVDRVARAVVHRLLFDADETVRLRAVKILNNLPAQAASADKLFEAARQPGLFQPQELADAMSHVLGQVAGDFKRGREAAALVRTLSGQRVPAAGAATLLAMHSPDYAVEVVERHGEGAARFAAQVAAIFAGYQRDRLLDFLRLLARLPIEARQDAWARMQVFLAVSPERAAQLAAQEGLPAPAAHPTADEARAALGV